MTGRGLGGLLVALGALTLWLAWRGHRRGVVVVQLGGVEYRIGRDERPRVYAVALALYVFVGAILVAIGVAVLAGLAATPQRG